MYSDLEVLIPKVELKYIVWRRGPEAHLSFCLSESKRLEDTQHSMRGRTDETMFDGQNFNPFLPLNSLNGNN